MADGMPMRAVDLPPPGQFGPVAYTPLAPMARFVFRGDSEAQQRLADLCQCAVPQPLRAALQGETSLLWQGPDEILVLSPDDNTALAARIARALGTVPHSCVDVTHRNVGFTVHGEGVTSLLSSAVMLDLDEREFPTGMVTRTLFAKADIVLWRRASDRFHIEVWRSFAPYVLAMLAEGARGL